MDFDINFWAVLVAGLASMVTGFIWYGPVFGKIWGREMGFDKLTQDQTENMRKEAQPNYIQQLVGAILMAFVFAHVLESFDSNSIADALQGAFWVWLGFIAPVKYSEVLWNNKSYKLFFIDSLYFLLNLVVFGIIFTLWR